MAKREDKRRTGQQYPKDDIRYQPTKAELEADISIDADTVDVLRALAGDPPPRRASRAMNQ